MSTTCSGCNKAIKIEDLVIKSYMPVNDVQTCGRVKVTKRGRIVARTIRAGDGITCEGSIEGRIETDGDLELGAKSAWKGGELQSRSLVVKDGATLNGHVCVPWIRRDDEADDEPKKATAAKTTATKTTASNTTASKKTASKKTASKKTSTKKTAATRKTASETTPKPTATRKTTK